MVWAREPCAEMVNLALLVDGMPERFHPKSFRCGAGGPFAATRFD